MKKIHKYGVFLIAMMVLFLLIGCTENPSSGKMEGSNGGTGLKPVGDNTDEEDTQSDELGKVYILKEVNETESQIVLIKVGGSYREYTLKYTGGTRFENRYGKSILASELICGEVFEMQTNEAGDTLKSLKESDDVWTFEAVKKFKLDLETEMIKVGDDKYHFSGSATIFSGNVPASRYDLSEKDVITLIGYKKELLSVIIENGHGTLQFTNITGFEEGYFVLGNAVAGQIAPGILVEVPSGDFALSIAHKGKGGKVDVTILPGETTIVDLAQFQEETTKTSQVTIRLKQEGTVVSINGKEVDTTQPITLDYGMYRITAELSGYDTWSRLLMVSSPEAAFTIDFGVTSDTDKEDSKDEDEDSEDGDSDASEEDESGDSEGDSDDEDDEDDDNVTDDLTNSLIDEVVDLLIGN